MMTPAIKRCLSEFAIGLMVCGAVHYFLIAPAEQEAARLRIEADAADSPRASGVAVSAEKLNELAAAAAAELDAVRVRNRIAMDHTELFSTITRLADESRVRLDQLEPAEPVMMPLAPPTDGAQSAAGAPPLTPAPVGPSDTMVSATMSVTGAYGGVARFLHALSSDAGFAVVKSVRLEPSEHPELVRAVIATQHYAFAIPNTSANAAPNGGQ